MMINLDGYNHMLPLRSNGLCGWGVAGHAMAAERLRGPRWPWAQALLGRP